MASAVSDEQRRRNRATAIVLALIAGAFFVTFIVAAVVRDNAGAGL